MKRRPHPERGATAILAAIVFVMLGGFMALAVNVAHMMDTRAQLINATDAAALAAAVELPNRANARAAAIALAQAHTVDKIGITITDADVEFGNWNLATATPGNKWSAFVLDGLPLNAVRVRAGRDGQPGHNTLMDVTLGKAFLGAEQARVRAESVAIGNTGPCLDTCPVPLVLAECSIRPGGGQTTCDTTLQFSNDSQDNVGFTSLVPGRPTSSNSVRDALQTCNQVEVGDVLTVQNGNDFNNQVAEGFEPLVNNWITIPVLDLECDADGEVKFNQPHTVVGFVRVKLLEVSVGPPKRLRIEYDCEDTSPHTGGGCANLGLAAVKLVR